MELDIKGIDKAELLAALHNGTPAIGMGRMHDIGRMSVEQAQRYVDNGELRFDYLCGRPLKCNISGDTMRFGLYDRDAGPGAAERIVFDLRQRQDARATLAAGGQS